MIERTFFSVGQALFCREKVERRTIVYDCGGQNEDIVNAVIDRVYKDDGKEEDKIIDALFISHYDKDHINGVFHLLNRCKVSHVFLPMVSPLARFLSLLGQRYTTHIKDFYADPKGYLQNLSDGTLFHYVEQANGSDLHGEADGMQQLEKSTAIIDNLFRDQDLIGRIYQMRFSDNPDWVYVPYNRKVMTQNEVNQMFSLLNLPPDCSLDDILKEWKRRKLSLKRVIREMGIIDFRKINDYSMTLYSGSINQRNACLYMGDYNAKLFMQDLKSAYSTLWQNIRAIQVPHHGSVNNYDCGLCQLNTEYVVSNKKGPYGRRAVDPIPVINHIMKVAGQQCYTTFSGDVIIN